MTEQPYESRLTSFKTGLEAAPIKTYPVVANGREELKKVGLGDYLIDLSLDYLIDLLLDYLIDYFIIKSLTRFRSLSLTSSSTPNSVSPSMIKISITTLTYSAMS